MRLLPAMVGTRLSKASFNRWTSEKCLTRINLVNEWLEILMSASGVSELGVRWLCGRQGRSQQFLILCCKLL